MATLASPQTLSVSRTPTGIQRDSRPSAFAAVNGSYTNGPKPETPIMGDTITVQANKQTYDHSQSSSRPTPPPSRQENPFVEYGNGSYNHQQLPSPTETSTNGTKRKRSISAERPPTPSRSTHERESQLREGDLKQLEQQQYRHQPIERMQEGRSEAKSDMDDRSIRDSGTTSRDSPTDSQRESYRQSKGSYEAHSPSDSDRPNHTGPPPNESSRWEPPASYPPMYENESPQNRSDQPMPDSAHRDLENQEQGQNGWGFQQGSSEPGEGDESNYTDSMHGQIGAKRKRNFSNRTKTGCMTCRKRKKKCEEGHANCDLFVPAWSLDGVLTHSPYRSKLPTRRLQMRRV